jgi:hypothetical protein
MKHKIYLTRRQLSWFEEVYRYIYEEPKIIEPLYIAQAFSDVHDGNLTVDEIRPLVRKHLLSWEPKHPKLYWDDEFDTIGWNTNVTVLLTPLGLALLQQREKGPWKIERVI